MLILAVGSQQWGHLRSISAAWMVLNSSSATPTPSTLMRWGWKRASGAPNLSPPTFTCRPSGSCTRGRNRLRRIWTSLILLTLIYSLYLPLLPLPCCLWPLCIYFFVIVASFKLLYFVEKAKYTTVSFLKQKVGARYYNQKCSNSTNSVS